MYIYVYVYILAETIKSNKQINKQLKILKSLCFQGPKYNLFNSGITKQEEKEVYVHA